MRVGNRIEHGVGHYWVIEFDGKMFSEREVKYKHVRKAERKKLEK